MGFFELLAYSLKIYAMSIVGFLSDPVAWLLIFIMYIQVKKAASIQRVIYGKKLKYSTYQLMTSSLVVSIIVGFIGTVIITVTGISFHDTTGFAFVIISSIVLMMFNPKYLCVSYSGGLWALIVLVISDLVRFGYISEADPVFGFLYKNLRFDVTALLVIIAILHLMEAILIFFDGYRGAIPIFVKRDNKLVGAFILQRFWVLPIIIFLAGSTGVLPLAKWWPIISPGSNENIIQNLLFIALPFIAILSYGDVAVITDVKKRAERSGIILFSFSIVLLAISLFSIKYHIFKYIGAIFAPLAHEILVIYEIRREKKGQPKWQYREDAIIILDTIPGSPAEVMELKTGDAIISINNTKVNTIEDAGKVLEAYPTYIWIDILNEKGEKRSVEYKDYANGIDSLGIITIPKDEQGIPMLKEKKSIIKKMVKKDK